MTLQSLCNALSKPIRIAIIEYIRDNGQSSVRDVADALFGSTENLIPVRGHLHNLCIAGLLERVQIGREHSYDLASGRHDIIRQWAWDMTDLFDFKFLNTNSDQNRTVADPTL